MAERVISNDDMQRIRLATSITKADVIDCIEDDDTIVFVVSKGFLGMAIGKNARNIEKLKEIGAVGVFPSGVPLSEPIAVSYTHLTLPTKA